MAALPRPEDLVLVALMPSPRDLEIARVLGWYRIPLISSPKIVAPDYLAFYQPAVFGEEHKWCIETIAPVKGHELVMRRQLFKDEPDHPHANDEYFKMQLGPLQQLPRAIPAGKWKRILFFYTTGELLNNAGTVDDLGIPDAERPMIYKALREKAIKYHASRAADLPENPLDLQLLALFFMRESGSAALDEV
jgi:hypothetical protein